MTTAQLLRESGRRTIVICFLVCKNPDFSRFQTLKILQKDVTSSSSKSDVFLKHLSETYQKNKKVILSIFLETLKVMSGLSLLNFRWRIKLEYSCWRQRRLRIKTNKEIIYIFLQPTSHHCIISHILTNCWLFPNLLMLKFQSDMSYVCVTLKSPLL